MTVASISEAIKNLSAEELRGLAFRVQGQLDELKKEKKILVWRVITHDAVAENFKADDYERAVDYLISRIKEFAIQECESVLEDGNTTGWSDIEPNREIPYIYPLFVGETEYKKDYESCLS